MDQDDDPWWLVAALGWLAMYDTIAQAQGKVGQNFRGLLDEYVRNRPPEFLYKFYQDFVRSCEAEAADA